MRRNVRRPRRAMFHRCTDHRVLDRRDGARRTNAQFHVDRDWNGEKRPLYGHVHNPFLRATESEKVQWCAGRELLTTPLHTPLSLVRDFYADRINEGMWQGTIALVALADVVAIGVLIVATKHIFSERETRAARVTKNLVMLLTLIGCKLETLAFPSTNVYSF